MTAHNLMIDNYIIFAVGGGEESQAVYVEIFKNSARTAVVVVSRFQHLFCTERRQNDSAALSFATVGKHDSIVGEMGS